MKIRKAVITAAGPDQRELITSGMTGLKRAIAPARR